MGSYMSIHVQDNQLINKYYTGMDLSRKSEDPAAHRHTGYHEQQKNLYLTVPV